MDTNKPCPYCGREEEGQWVSPCTADDCPSREYPFEDWQNDVRNGDTRLGYDEWVAHQIESHEGRPDWCPKHGGFELDEWPNCPTCTDEAAESHEIPEKTPDEKWGFISLQTDEDEGTAECGCKLVRLGADDENPAFFLCPLHSAAPDMLEVLQDELHAVRGWRDGLIALHEDPVIQDILQGLDISEDKIETVLARLSK